MQYFRFLSIYKGKDAIQIIMRYLLSFFVGVLLSASLYAQSAGDKRSSFSVHAGPSWYLGALCRNY